MDFSEKRPKKNTILFIRHGISCANIRKKLRIFTDHTMILDPTLTIGGILKAQQRGKCLREGY